jgi:hypothetical protein
VKPAKPRDLETKGRIERANGYLDSSFEPVRRFTSIGDVNRQLDEWLERKANRRIVRATGARPADLLSEQRGSMGVLPDPLASAAIETVIRLGRDYHIRLAGCDYSIDPTAIGRIVTVKATLTRVEAVCEGVAAASHTRCLKPRQAITDPAHVATAAAPRARYQDRRPRANPRPGRHLVLVEDRDLASYDQLWQETPR